MAAVTETPTNVVTVHDVRNHSGGDEIMGGSGRDEKSSMVEAKHEAMSKSESEIKPDSEIDMQNLVAMITKLNPSAEEFFPSNYNQKNNHQGKFNRFPADDFEVDKKQSGDEFYNKKNGNNRRRKSYNQWRRRSNGKVSKAQREDSIKRTVYVSDIDHTVTEEQLADLFSNCGQVADCRICGDPHSVLRFAFVEFADEHGAHMALSLNGTMLGFYPVKVLPSKTPILPVNPSFLPRSVDEREMCTRTIYCTNIDKQVTEGAVKSFFQSTCGEVTRLRLLGDQLHSTRIAFVEFALAESALMALNCSGMVLCSLPIRVSPSKTPVRPRSSRSSSTD